MRSAAAPELRDAAERGFTRHHELTEIAFLLTHTFDIQQILSNLMEAALRLAEAEVGALWLQRERLSTSVTWGLEQEMAEQVMLASGETVPCFVSRTGEIFWSPDCARDPRITGLPEAVRIESMLAIPLGREDRVLGCIVIVNRPSRELEEEDRDALMALAGFATVAIENARLHQVELEKQSLERELGIARQVQLALLPARDPEGGGIQWSSSYFPVGKVGGDYYDYVRGPLGREGVVVADVSDKGVPAALFMAATRNLVRREAQASPDPAEVMKGVNLQLCEDTERFASIFVTLFYGLYDPRERSFCFANAGHCPALWARPGREPAWLTAQGTILGQFPEAQYVTGRVELAPGDTLVLYTDGVTEAHAPDGTLFGRQRLMNVVRGGAELESAELAASIVEEVRRYGCAAGVRDDLTVVVGRVK